MIGFCAHATKRILAAAMALLVFTTSQASLAAEPPFPNKTISLAPRGQLVADAIRDLYAQAGLKVKVSSLLKEKISGKWMGPPATIWAEFAKAYNLVAFYDGSVVRVYSASEITTQSYNTPAPDSVVSSASKMGYTSGANRVKAGPNTVTATGVPEYQERIRQLAASATAPVAKVAAVTPTPLPPSSTVASSGIVSPIAGRPNGALPSTTTLASVTPRYEVLSRPTIRDPYEVRIFFLKYAKSDDVPKDLGDRTIIIPGIVTALKNIMGDGRGSGSKITVSGRGDGPRDPDFGEGDINDAIDSGGYTIVKENGSPDVNGPRIYGHTSKRAVIVRDRPEAMRTYEGIISKLDTRPLSINIVATIIDIDVEKTKRLGVDFNFRLNALSAVFGGSPIDALGGGNAGNVQGTYLSQNSNALSVRIDAMQRQGNLQIVKSTTLNTLDNVPATLDNRLAIALRATGRSRGDVNTVRVGTLLTVTPSIAKEADQFLTMMEIDLRDGSIAGFLGDGSPVLAPSSISNSAQINEGESLIIGGITITTNQEIRSRTPLLGDIPVLGLAFQKSNTTSSRIERVVIITPYIISNEPNVAQSNTGYSAPIPLEQIQGVAQQDGKQDKKAKKRKKQNQETEI